MNEYGSKSSDKHYKFMYKRLRVKIHRYFYDEGESIEFKDIEIADTGQQRDITIKVDNEFIENIEFQTSPLDDEKLLSMYDYFDDMSHDIENIGLYPRSRTISTASPKHGKSSVEVNENITFKTNVFFTKNIDGLKVLNNITYKVFTDEELSDNEAIDLLILPDMNIDMPVRQLVILTCYLIKRANIPDKEFRDGIIQCGVSQLKRFFNGNELKRRIKMLVKDIKNPKAREMLEILGPGYIDEYFDAMAEGKFEIVKNLIAEGVSDEIISRASGLSIAKIEKIRRNL